MQVNRFTWNSLVRLLRICLDRLSHVFVGVDAIASWIECKHHFVFKSVVEVNALSQ
jgi:hypothetical protein